MPTTISYDDFCDLAATLAPAWFDELTEPAREYVLAKAWENCAWSRLSNERIVEAFEKARLT